jgi:hypothetical protein
VYGNALETPDSSRAGQQQGIEPDGGFVEHQDLGVPTRSGKSRNGQTGRTGWRRRAEGGRLMA